MLPCIEAFPLARTVVPVALVVDVTIGAHVLLVHVVDQIEKLRESARALQPLTSVCLVL